LRKAATVSAGFTLFVLLGLLVVRSHAAAPGPAAWLLSYNGKTMTDVYFDKRFHPLLRNSLPNLPAKWWGKNSRVVDAANDFLEGSPNLVSVRGGRFAILSSSVSGVGGNFGMLWVDCQSGRPSMIFAADYSVSEKASLYIYPNSLADAQSLPPSFLNSLASWLDEIASHKITGSIVVSPDGRSIPFDMGRVPESSGTPQE
jgi:hypothetical protein